MSAKIDQLIRCKRRSVGLMITQDARLVVRAPHWMPVHEIERLVQQKEHWIIQKQVLSRKRSEQPSLNLSKEEQIALKQKAFEYISQKTAELAKAFGLTYTSLKVNDAKTRWGSCGQKGNLNFTWRLIMAPQRVVDYVIIHELMHLKQMNHSPKFWIEVAKARPDYMVDERWLKENGHCLRLK